MTTTPPQAAFPGKESMERDVLEEGEYLNRVKDYFIKIREGALFLSPRDIETIREWLKEGIPLEALFYGIDRYFEKRKRAVPSGGRRDSLRRTEKDVLKAWQEIREAGLGKKYSREETSDFSGVLASISSRLREALEKKEELSPLRSRIGSLLSEIELFREDIEAEAITPVKVEEALIRMEGELFEELKRILPGEALSSFSEKIDGELARYEGRMSPEVVRATKENMLRKEIRETLGLPRLSLFI